MQDLQTQQKVCIPNTSMLKSTKPTQDQPVKRKIYKHNTGSTKATQG